MATPDFTEYIDLTVYDRQPIDIYNDAVTYARTALPEWTPVAGSVEDAVLQAVAQMTGELSGAINRLPSSVLEGLLQLFGIDRNTGTAATGTLTVNVIDNLGYTIPVGTRFGYIDNTDPTNRILYTFDTDEDLTIAQGSTSGTVAITATTAIQYPALPGGTTLQLLSSLSYVNSGTLVDNLSFGADPETTTEYLARGIAKLNSYTTALVTPSQIQQYILTTYPDVLRCKVYNRRNPANDDYNDAEENGYITVYACKVGGASLTASAASAIAEDVADRTVAGLSTTVKNPYSVAITLTTTVTAKTGYGQSTIENNIETALSQYLHPDYWDWSPTIYYNELISLIDQVEGVDRVVSLSISSASGTHASGSDLEFDKFGSLPTVSATVTVQAS